jgi:hypothetical protein
MGRLRPYATGLNPKEATRMLGDHLRYSFETAFTGIWREPKQLQRRHLATLGLSEDACNPRYGKASPSSSSSPCSTS